MDREANTYVDYQARARSFRVGDEVSASFNPNSMSGVIVALWPAIGMADVQFPYGASRVPVEDMCLVDDAREPPGVAKSTTVAGGVGTAFVSAGPSNKRVAHRYVKALYWAAPDRKYRVTRKESDGNCHYCPRCPRDVGLTKRLYKMEGGVRDYILTCPKCTFIVHTSDLITGD